MKLYTEEQVRELLELTNLNVKFYMDEMYPIEIPNFIDIRTAALDRLNSLMIDNPENHMKAIIDNLGFVIGAEWVIDKIKNQSNQ